MSGTPRPIPSMLEVSHNSQKKLITVGRLFVRSGESTIPKMEKTAFLRGKFFPAIGHKGYF
jgi:hypothetical protein